MKRCDGLDCRGRRAHEPNDPPWWSADKKQQERNRRVYHGKRLFSLYAINHLSARHSRKRADADAVKAARRFSFSSGYREAIYRAGAGSRRALQLIDVFPVLALTIYAENAHCYNEEFTDPERWEN